jgi:hypothetical protein
MFSFNSLTVISGFGFCADAANPKITKRKTIHLIFSKYFFIRITQQFYLIKVAQKSLK